MGLDYTTIINGDPRDLRGAPQRDPHEGYVGKTPSGKNPKHVLCLFKEIFPSQASARAFPASAPVAGQRSGYLSRRRPALGLSFRLALGLLIWEGRLQGVRRPVPLNVHF